MKKQTEQTAPGTAPTADLERLLRRRPASLDELLADMSPAVAAQLRQAIELGKWGDGNRLSPEQLESCLQALLLYEERYLPAAERTRNSLPKSCATQNEAVSVEVGDRKR